MELLIIREKLKGDKWLDKWIKTFHDIALGLFINSVYGLTQGDIDLANIYVLIVSIISIYLTNKEKKWIWERLF